MTGRAPREGWRRAIHCASGVAGLIATRLPQHTMTIALCALAAIAVGADVVRLTSSPASAAITKFAGPLFRPAEARTVSGATLLAAGYALTWLLFPGSAAARAITVTAVADPVAATIGSWWGRPGPGGKSLAGTAAALTAAAVILLAWGTPLLAAVPAAAVAALAERVPGRGADNLFIPLATGLALVVFA